MGSAWNDVWAAGGDARTPGCIVHWDGGAWSVARQRMEGTFTTVWGTGARDVWAAGASVVHWDGTSWSSFALPDAKLSAAGGWSARAADAWLVGTASLTPAGVTGRAYHWDGVKWSTIPGADLLAVYRGVWGSGPADVWAVASRVDNLGSDGIVHWDGTAWSRAPISSV